MQTATYPRIKIGTKLLAAALAVAGSAVMVGGNLVVAATYAANAGVAPSTMVAPRRHAAPGRRQQMRQQRVLRLPQTRVAAIERAIRNDAGNPELRLRGLDRSFSVSRSFAASL